MQGLAGAGAWPGRAWPGGRVPAGGGGGGDDRVHYIQIARSPAAVCAQLSEVVMEVASDADTESRTSTDECRTVDVAAHCRASWSSSSSSSFKKNMLHRYCE